MPHRKESAALHVGVEFVAEPKDKGIVSKNRKRGLVQAPFSQLTPQNREPSRGSVPATPGSQSFSCEKGEQAVCQLSQKFDHQSLD